MPSPARQLSSSTTTESAACFIAGLAAVLMSYSIYSHLKTAADRNHQSLKRSDHRSERKLEDALRLKSLAYLTQSHNVNIQHSSIKIILDRAMTAAYLPKIIAACDKNQPISIRIKALPCLQLLTRKGSNKAALLQAGALDVLVDALKCTDPILKDAVKRYVAVAICDLIQGNDANKCYIMDLGVLEPIKSILTANNIRNNELKYWILMILYHLSLTDPPPQILAKDGFVGILARMARMTYGNTNMPKFCMRSLVRITANIDDPLEAQRILRELLQPPYNIVELILSCLRQGDDVELIFWAAGLMHELVLKDVAAEQFRAVKGIHTILSGLLSAEEMYISRVILRTVRFMAYDQDEFRREMVKSGMVKKIMQCLAIENEDVKYWATLCVHVVAGEVRSHAEIVTAPEFEVLLELAVSKKMKVAIFVSDILSLICCISSNNDFMTPKLSQIINTLQALLTDGEVDVQYNAAGAIFNVMAMTYTFANKVRDVCFDTLIDLSTSASHERVQLTCTKGALMVAIKNRFLISQVNQQVTEPLIDSVNQTVEAILPLWMVQSLIRSSKASRNDSADVDKKNVSNSHNAVDDITADSVDYIRHELFNTTGNSREQVEVWAKYEPPLKITQQLTGALSSLTILLENERILQNVLTGEPQHAYKYSMLDVADNIVMDVDDISPSIYDQKSYATHSSNNNNSDTNERNQQQQQQQQQQPQRRPLFARESTFSSSSSLSLLSATATPVATSSSSPVLEKLSENKRRFIDHLVLLSLYPVLDEWTLIHHQKYPLEAITKVELIYDNFIDWIKNYVERPKKIINVNRREYDETEELVRYSEESKTALLRKRRSSSGLPSTRTTANETGNLNRQRNRPQEVSVVEDGLITFHLDMDSDRSFNSSSDSISSSSNSSVSSEDILPSFVDTNSRQQEHQQQETQPVTISDNLQSAAERLGETRRTEELVDVSDLLSMSLETSLSPSISAGPFANSGRSGQHLLLTHRALSLLSVMMRNASVRQYLVYEANFLHILVYILEYCLKYTDNHKLGQQYHYTATTDRILACLANLLVNDEKQTYSQKQAADGRKDNDRLLPERLIQHLSILTWQNVHNLSDLFSVTIAPGIKRRKRHIAPQLFYSRIILSACMKYITFNNINGMTTVNNHDAKKRKFAGMVTLDDRIRSKYCLVDQESHLRIRNDTWTFETVRTTHCVPALHDIHHHLILQRANRTSKYAYEVVLETDGLMQIGWVTDHFQFDPEGGKGVGDDIHSYGYDGNRCKKWHRRTYEHHHHAGNRNQEEEETSENCQQRKKDAWTSSYGIKWSEGDVITCAIDMEKGELRYFTNGRDMGVAFTGTVITTRAWYPAISLATGQQCRFRFGDKANPLEYLPDGYTPIAALAEDSIKQENVSASFGEKDESDEEVTIDLQPLLSENSEEVAYLNHSSDIDDSKMLVGEEKKKEAETSTILYPNTDTEEAKVGKNCIYVSVQKRSALENQAISLYYEVTFGKLDTENLTKLGFHSLHSNRAIHFEYIPQTKSFALIYADSDSPITYVPLTINDGDTIGVVYIEQLHRLGLVQNGEIGVFVELEEYNMSRDLSLYLPLVDECSQALSVNYGEDPFMWKLANLKSYKHYMSCYLLSQL